jgi:alkanesulfonate monooxygenase SsuD/methylene tetrahydromethanopterin reductase-like flavin-dependent oxidoreductase (luciferase family)
LGVPFAGRGRRTEETIAAMRALWSQEQASYTGSTTSFRDCFLRPQPPGGTIPVHVGGHSDAAAQRAGRIGDGFFPLGVTRDELVPLLAVMRRSAEAAGRDPETIEVTVVGSVTTGEETLAEAADLSQLGVTRVIVPAVLFREDLAASLTRYSADVIDRA